MKKLIIISILFMLVAFMGCRERDFWNDSNPPAAPTGLYSVNGDGWVELHWNKSNSRNVDGYKVYVSNSYNGRYDYIGSTRNNYFLDDGVTNGRTYYYAVSAYNMDGVEGDLSMENIYNTPRPEGMNQSVYDFRKFPTKSGYDFSDYKVKPYNDNNTDMYFDNDSGYYYMVVYDDTDIQDMGATYDIYDIPTAPRGGWSTTKDVLLKSGHTYVVWTHDDHYAKFRVYSLAADRVVFDWAYQTVQGNTQLKSAKSKDHVRGVLTTTDRTPRIKK